MHHFFEYVLHNKLILLLLIFDFFIALRIRVEGIESRSCYRSTFLVLFPPQRIIRLDFFNLFWRIIPTMSELLLVRIRSSRNFTRF